MSDLGARGEPAQREGVWVDWSGITAVWVCECGQQGFGGFTSLEGRSGAMRHRALSHPDWKAVHKVYITPVPCNWGNHIYAEMKGGETCQKDAVANGYCINHNGYANRFEAYGVCALEDCIFLASKEQPVCRTHATEWARKNGLDQTRVHAGEIVWPHVPPKNKSRNRGPATVRLLPYKTKHGTRAGYKAGCRCPPCAVAQSTYASEARRRRLERGAE